MTVELAEPVQIFWWMALGMGGVVIVCLVVLLSLLRGLLIDIDTQIAGVATELDALAENTAASGLLERAATAIGGMGAELEQHVAALSKGGQ